MKRSAGLRLAMCLALWACAPDLRDDFPFDCAASTGPLITVADDGTGLRTLRVDATNKSAWTYLDLDQDTELKVDVAFATNAWDLAFKRFEVIMNGGGSNPTGVVEVAVLSGIDFAALVKAPSTGFLKDTSEAVFAVEGGGWYFYDFNVHKVAPRPELVYVVRSSGGRYFKLKLLKYYDDAGTPAQLTAQYQPIEAPQEAP